MKKKLKILIIEDDPVYQKVMTTLLNESGEEDNHVVDNYEDAKMLLMTRKFDIVLIDLFINGEKTGVTLGQYIKANYKLPFIYVTSNLNHHVLEIVKDTKPRAVISKPIDADTFISNIRLNTYDQEVEETNFNILDDRIFIKEDGIYQKISLNDIVYIESDHVYNNIYTKTGKRLFIRGRLKDFHEKFPKHFIQINRGCVINMLYIDHFDKQTITVNNKVLEIGRKFKSFVYSRLVFF